MLLRKSNREWDVTCCRRESDSYCSILERNLEVVFHNTYSSGNDKQEVHRSPSQNETENAHAVDISHVFHI